MNGRERLAGAILVITVTVGILTGVLGWEKTGRTLPGENQKETSDSCDQSRHEYVVLDINTATREELMALPSIGPTRAGAIIEWRDRNGLFEKVEDLVQVKGIGEKTLAVIRKYVCAGGGESLPGE
ncbi:MAG: helix-hairpin-helix domain-containing protein [Candidatus Eisenbacteria bacterium]